MGDTFTVAVVGEVLTYQVIESQVIKPEETHAILADPDRDLVTAERITPTPIEDFVAGTAKPQLPGFPWWAVILSGSVLAAGVFIWRAGYPAKPRKRKGDEVVAA